MAMRPPAVPGATGGRLRLTEDPLQRSTPAAEAHLAVEAKEGPTGVAVEGIGTVHRAGLVDRIVPGAELTALVGIAACLLYKSPTPRD